MSEVTDLIEQAREAALTAYAPYSNFRVGAVAVGEDGSVHRSANVENASFGSGVCAESNAITSAVASGVRKVRTVAVVCLDGEGCYPCGDCRQIMREFGVERIIVEDGSGGVRIHSLDELLPHSFGPESLP